MATKQYQLTSKVHGGPQVLQPGDVIELEPEVAQNTFWKSRVVEYKEAKLIPATPKDKK